MVKRPTGSGGEPSSPNCGASAGGRARHLTPLEIESFSMRTLTICLLSFSLSACGTALAIADGVGTVAVYGVKTVINTVDAITPDIVNKKKD